MIPERIREVLEERGIRELTPPQLEAIPRILTGESLLLIAPTGVGKTEAAMIPFFTKIMEERPRPISLLYITPMRSLNRDLGQRLEWYGARLGISVAVRHGDTPPSERRRQVLRPPDVLITTPETFQIALTVPSLRRHLENVRFVVLDEVHELADTERGVQLAVGLRRLRRICGGFQIVALSATLGNPEEVKVLFGIRGPTLRVPVEKMVEVVIDAPEGPDEELSEEIGADPWYAATISKILDLVNKHRATLVFVNTRYQAEDLAQRLRLLGGRGIAVHHGSLTKNIRVEAEEAFKRGDLRALVCTSSLELGIDIGRADHVIQLHSPKQVARLLQRVGRSGHGVGRVSRGTVVYHRPFELAESMAIASLARKGWVEPKRVRKDPMVVIANQLMSAALEMGSFELRWFKELLAEVPAFGDLDLVEEVAQLLASQGIIGLDGGVVRKRRKTYRAFYENLSMIPDESKWLVVDAGTRKMVGLLDESFVFSSLEPDSTFVLRGQVWRVLSMDLERMRILVERLEDVSEPPRWLGEEIPVFPEVARATADLLNEGPSFATGEAARAVEALRGSLSRDAVYLEKEGNTVVLLHPFGTKLAYSLALLLSKRLEAMYGSSIAMDSSQYHVLLEGHYLSGDAVLAALRMEGDPAAEVEEALPGTGVFWYVLYHVARKFGLRLDIRSVRRPSTARRLSRTPIWREALAKVEWDYLDLGALQELLTRIRDGSLPVVERPMQDATEELLSERRELFRAIVPTRKIVEMVKKRLLRERFVFGCMNCKRMWRMRVYEFDEPICPFCRGRRLVVAKEFYEEKLRRVLKGECESESFLRSVLAAGNLLVRYGRDALLALAGHGVGPQTAARILMRARDEEDLIRRVIEAETHFEKIRPFMD